MVYSVQTSQKSKNIWGEFCHFYVFIDNKDIIISLRDLISTLRDAVSSPSLVQARMLFSQFYRLLMRHVYVLHQEIRQFRNFPLIRIPYLYCIYDELFLSCEVFFLLRISLEI